MSVENFGAITPASSFSPVKETVVPVPNFFLKAAAICYADCVPAMMSVITSFPPLFHCEYLDQSLLSANPKSEPHPETTKAVFRFLSTCHRP